MEVTLTLQNAAQIKKVFKNAPGIASVEYKKSLDAIASMVQRTAIKKAPVNKGKTKVKGRKGYGGNLRQSIKKTPFGLTGFKVTVNADYGVYVDQGTPPHVITPRGKNFLVFKGKQGNWVRTKRVNHPGQKPTYFFTNAVKESEQFADKEMASAMDRVLRRL